MDGLDIHFIKYYGDCKYIIGLINLYVSCIAVTNAMQDYYGHCIGLEWNEMNWVELMINIWNI